MQIKFKSSVSKTYNNFYSRVQNNVAKLIIRDKYKSNHQNKVKFGYIK